MIKFQELKGRGCSLKYCYDQENHRWEIGNIRSRVPGGGKRIVSRFVKEIAGTNQAITTPLLEAKSISTLEEKFGLLSLALASSIQPVIVSDYEVLGKLKIVRVLEGGGIKVDRLELFKEMELDEIAREGLYDDDLPVTVNLYGRT